jgi:hypothetical protein
MKMSVSSGVAYVLTAAIAVTATSGVAHGAVNASGMTASREATPSLAMIGAPEPSSIGVLGLGAVALLRRRRR